MTTQFMLNLTSHGTRIGLLIDLPIAAIRYNAKITKIAKFVCVNNSNKVADKLK